MRNEPWSKNRWSPGVLSCRNIKQLVAEGFLKHQAKSPEDWQKSLTDLWDSALDLAPSDEAYQLSNGSVKPSGGNYLQELVQRNLAIKIKAESDGTFLLSPRHTYLFRAEISLVANLLESSPIHGQATAKSSVGRVDVLARLIVDGMSSYEQFSPDRLRDGDGSLYIEVTPLTFPVRVKPGKSLTQLRLFNGNPADSEVRGKHVYRSVLNSRHIDEPLLTLDLSQVAVNNKSACAFRARDGDDLKPIPLWTDYKDKKNDKGYTNQSLTLSQFFAPWDQVDPDDKRPRPAEYWEPKPVGEHNRFTIEPGSFYIFRSKELIAVPKGIAVYCRAIDETIGEIRIHYAGFVHPHFGEERKDGQPGAPLIFEVRGHSVKASLRDGEILARLVFYRMAEDAGPSAAANDQPSIDSKSTNA